MQKSQEPTRKSITNVMHTAANPNSATIWLLPEGHVPLSGYGTVAHCQLKQDLVCSSSNETT